MCVWWGMVEGVWVHTEDTVPFTKPDQTPWPLCPSQTEEHTDERC